MASSARKLIFVVGMHRSLTSFVASMVAKAFGGFIADRKHILHGGAGNRPGYFESKRVFRLNDQILKADGMTWRTVRKHPLVTAADRERIISVLREDFADKPVSVIKDPRLCYMLHDWYTQALQFYRPEDIFVLYVVRHPIQVAQSLKNLHDVPLCEGIDMWLFHNASALYFLQQFDDLPDEGRSERWCAIATSDPDKKHFLYTLKRIKKALGFKSMNGQKAVGSYKPSEKHFSSTMPEGDPFPECEDLRVAVDVFDQISDLAKSTGPTQRVDELHRDISGGRPCDTRSEVR